MLHDIITRTLTAFSFLPQVHAVGGVVRDALLGLDPNDVDLATSAHPDEVMRFVQEQRWTAVPTGIGHGTITAVHPDLGHVEITTFRRDIETDGRRATVAFADNINEDLARRDLTINALAYNLNEGLIDPFGGATDMRSGMIRFVLDPRQRIKEDRLRVIRAVRFAARFGFEIESATYIALVEAAPTVLDRVSIERVRDEIGKSFNDAKPSLFLRALYDLGILTDPRVLPELAGAHVLDQNPEHHPEGDVLTHILQVVDRAPAKHRWHALLHDIGKPATAERDPAGGWYRFYGHAEVGADIIPVIARRLRLSNDLAESLEVVTRFHMLPLEYSRQQITDRTVRRFQARAGEYLSDLQVLCLADAGERRGVPDRLFTPLPAGVQPVLMGRHLVAAGYRHVAGATSGLPMNFTDALKRAYEYQLDTGCMNIDELMCVAVSGEAFKETEM